jgi:hypothetical protein
MAAAASVEMGALEHAERLLRAAIAYRGDDRVQRANALAELGDLLERLGRGAVRPAAARVAAEAEACFDPEGRDELFEREGPYEWQLIRRDDPCPCGSGKKHGDCCYDVAPDDELEFGLLCEVLEPLMDAAIAEDPALFAAEFARIAGPEYEGLPFEEISPLLPDFQAEWVYMHWFTLDRTDPPALARLMRQHPQLPGRERALLERAARSYVSLFRVVCPRGKAHINVTDVLQETKFRSETGAVVLFTAHRQLVLARFIELDGHLTPMPHILEVEEGREETMIALARARFAEFQRVHPELAGTALMKRFAPVLYRAWLDALHAEVEE